MCQDGTRHDPVVPCRRKAITFFLHAASYAELTVSPFFKGKTNLLNGTAPRRAASRRARTTRRKTSETLSDLNVAAPAPSSDRHAMRRQYFELLMKKADA